MQDSGERELEIEPETAFDLEHRVVEASHRFSGVVRAYKMCKKAAFILGTGAVTVGGFALMGGGIWLGIYDLAHLDTIEKVDQMIYGFASATAVAGGFGMAAVFGKSCMDACRDFQHGDYTLYWPPQWGWP
ncbi:hypothetical protein HYS48_04600 [Candidatus Woesearchaeota archaeon]|nr:hypothetical protein [Candidatus Woesearchaeota archaeon]